MELTETIQSIASSPEHFDPHHSLASARTRFVKERVERLGNRLTAIIEPFDPHQKAEEFGKASRHARDVKDEYHAISHISRLVSTGSFLFALVTAKKLSAPQRMAVASVGIVSAVTSFATHTEELVQAQFCLDTANSRTLETHDTTQTHAGLVGSSNGSVVSATPN